jgi:hypothetical protein
MNLKVKIKLNKKCNESETFLDFIRDSEKEFGLNEKQFNTCTIKDLNIYIDFLNELWNK